MSSLPHLREFIKERLTAACEEIFSEVQKTVVQYEEEISRQRRLLDISRKPDTHSHITDLPQQHDCEEEEGLDEQQVCNQERNSSLDQEDPEPPQIKEAQEELCSSQEGEQLGLKQQSEDFIIWIDEDRLRMLRTICKPEIVLHRIDHVCEEEEVLTEQQVCNQERNSSLDQEDPEPPQITDEQEELCSSQDGEQLGLKQENDAFKVTLTYENSNHSTAEPNSEQLLSHRSAEAESRDLEESQHVDSGSTRNAELKQRRPHRKRAVNTAVSESQRRADTRKKSAHCDTCGKTFSDKSKLKTHLRIHTGEKPYCCKTCGKMFNYKSHFEHHIRTHTGEKPNACSTCGKRFIHKSNLDRHIRTHTGEKPYTCSTCGKRFSLNCSLERHIRTHTGEKPYTCSTCGKRFTQTSKLQRHMRSHTGEKSHCCATCGKRFKEKSDLDRHMRTHTGKKPYSCEICEKRFRQSAHLKKHMRVHAGS